MLHTANVFLGEGPGCTTDSEILSSTEDPETGDGKKEQVKAEGTYKIWMR